MTAIVAIEAEGSALIGCDSFIGDEMWRDLTDSPKWVRRGPLILACAGDVRASQIAETASFPKQKRGEGDFDYLVRGVAETIRQAHEDHDVEDENFQAIIIYHNKVYCLLDKYGLLRSRHRYMAIGAGADVALGSLASTAGRKPYDRVKVALQAAERHSNHVAGPFTVVTVK